jgi:hypothetical protein
MMAASEAGFSCGQAATNRSEIIGIMMVETASIGKARFRGM